MQIYGYKVVKPEVCYTHPVYTPPLRVVIEAKIRDYLRKAIPLIAVVILCYMCPSLIKPVSMILAALLGVGLAYWVTR